jgi:6-pyruvoyltetrahydropterin/6-carboxytetrahydropterin synthase
MRTLAQQPVETPPAHTAAPAAWAIRIDKEYHKFSAAHFLIFEDGTAERLHGHNYRVGLELEAPAVPHGVVLDFRVVKALLGEVLEPLDECFLVPGLHPVLNWERSGGEITVRYRERRYVLPADEVNVLPIENSSAECLARHIATELAEALRREAPKARFTRLAISVEETPGQRAVFALHA